MFCVKSGENHPLVIKKAGLSLLVGFGVALMVRRHLTLFCIRAGRCDIPYVLVHGCDHLYKPVERERRSFH